MHKPQDLAQSPSQATLTSSTMWPTSSLSLYPPRDLTAQTARHPTSSTQFLRAVRLGTTIRRRNTRRETVETSGPSPTRTAASRESMLTTAKTTRRTRDLCTGLRSRRDLLESPPKFHSRCDGQQTVLLFLVRVVQDNIDDEARDNDGKCNGANSSKKSNNAIIIQANSATDHCEPAFADGRSWAIHLRQQTPHLKDDPGHMRAVIDPNKRPNRFMSHNGVLSNPKLSNMYTLV